jgi:hypothetical protein
VARLRQELVACRYWLRDGRNCRWFIGLVRAGECVADERCYDDDQKHGPAADALQRIVGASEDVELISTISTDRGLILNFLGALRALLH